MAGAGRGPVAAAPAWGRRRSPRSPGRPVRTRFRGSGGCARTRGRARPRCDRRGEAVRRPVRCSWSCTSPGSSPSAGGPARRPGAVGRRAACPSARAVPSSSGTLTLTSFTVARSACSSSSLVNRLSGGRSSPSGSRASAVQADTACRCTRPRRWYTDALTWNPDQLVQPLLGHPHQRGELAGEVDRAVAPQLAEQVVPDHRALVIEALGAQRLTQARVVRPVNLAAADRRGRARRRAGPCVGDSAAAGRPGPGRARARHRS